METITSSAFKAIVQVTPPDPRPRVATSFFSIQTDNRNVLPRFSPLRHKRMPGGLLQPISASRFSSSDHLQMNFHDDKFEAQGRVMATVHVRFQLQRECLFGEQFYLVGDSPMIGCWDTQIAVPLEWSEGHIWTVDMDIPIEETLQYKFILKGESSKDVIWQPGSDRILSTWKTNNKIVVCEDWDDSLLQKVKEEEPAVYIHQISSIGGGGGGGASDNLSFEDEMTLSNAMPMTTSSTTKMEKKDEEIFKTNLNTLRKRFAMHEGGNGVVATTVNSEDVDHGSSHEETETEPTFVAKSSSTSSSSSSSSYGPDLVDEYKVVPEVKA